MSERDEVTVGSILQERILHRAEVLSEGDLSRALRWCHRISDVDLSRGNAGDVAVMVNGRDLTERLLQQVAAAGVPVVFVLDAADRPQGVRIRTAAPVTVVAVPDGVTPRLLSETVARLGLAHENHVLQYAQRVHGALAQQLHRGAGVSALSSRMARLSGCAVAVVATDLRLLAFDPGPSGWLQAQTISATIHELQDQLWTPAAGVQSHGTTTVATAIDGRSVTCIIGAIALADSHDGWIVVVNTDVPAHDHDLAEHRVLVEQAATIVGTELLRVRSVERAEERARGNFAHALLHGRFSNRSDLVARASHHDFAVEGRYGVVIARSAGLIADGDAPARLADMAREALRVAEASDKQTLTAVVGDVLAVVREVSPAGRAHPDPTVRELNEYAVALEKRLEKLLQRPVQVAYGRPVLGADQISRSYSEARMALDLGERLRLDRVCGFDDLRVDSALLGLAQDAAGRVFAEDVLAPLRADRGSLLEVAREYVSAGGNVNESARRLGIHRNTMLYKLDRISRLLERDVREADTQFTIWLALRLAILAETAELVARDVRSG